MTRTDPAKELRDQFEAASVRHLPKGGGPGGSGGDIEQRLQAVERRLDDMRPVLDEIRHALERARDDRQDAARRMDERFSKLGDKIAGIDTTIARIDGRLSHMPSTWQLIGLVVAIFGLAFVVVRFAGAGP